MDQAEKRRRAIGARIKARLAEIGKGQAQLAREIGVGPVTVWRYIEGATDPERKLVKLARALGVSVDWLESGGEDTGDPVMRVVTSFVRDMGPTLRPPLTEAEARWLAEWPHHGVTHGRLLDAVLQIRKGLTEDEAQASAEATATARAKGEALGVPARRKS